MAEFDDRRKEYAAARAAADAKRTDVVRASEVVKQLRRQTDYLARQANLGSSGEPITARLREAQAELTQAEEKAAAQKRQYQRVLGTLRGAHLKFAGFSDPTKAVGHLSDDVPIALFPLRLETRFKTLQENGVPQTWLWVRAYPDDALVDTFQPEIAASEYKNVAKYWTHKWRAGGDPAGQRAAWAGLVRSYGAGRARWLLEQIAPTNPADEPQRASHEHILVVRPPTPVQAVEQPPIARFWSRVWATNGAGRDAAFGDLVTALGADRAAAVETQLEPVNLRDVAVKPSSALTPRVVFLDLPQPATLPISQDAWTRAARAWLLPEQLVLLGFRGGREVLRELGNPIPPDLQIGPDPAAEGEQLEAGGPELTLPEAVRWTVDFQDAVRKGMAFAVNLTARNIVPPFDRLFVLGVRVSSDATHAATELSELIRHHQASRKGFSLLPQGRPTNNTDTSSAGYSWWENPDESFRVFFEGTANEDPRQWQVRKDGAWLAGWLGLEPSVLRASPYYYGTDQAEARAMNAALWPATLGYYMEQMMAPVFSENAVLETRSFFNRFVIGRGVVPLIRIGKQPYGILPVTRWSKSAFWQDAGYREFALQSGLPNADRLQAIHALTERAAMLWRELSSRVGHVGAAGVDPQQTLLDILGLHPTSAEFYYRYSQSFTQHYNALGFATEPVSDRSAGSARARLEAGLQALSEFGWVAPPGSEMPELLEKVFLKRSDRLSDNLVEAQVSESAPLSVTRADGLNYLAWLQLAARTSHDVLRKQEGFPANSPPTALLYLLLHHALDLGFVDAGLVLKRTAFNLSDAAYKAAKKQPKFLHVSDEHDDRSTWEDLYRPDSAITGDAKLRLGDYIPRAQLAAPLYLQTQVAAIDVLTNATTAALERAFVEHLDCLSYRMDAWRNGLQAVQLSFLRRDTDEGFVKSGIYLGAFGWLENVAPSSVVLEQVGPDATLGGPFDGSPLLRDPQNYGHIHAPSLDQAVTAAILRNGHLAHATPQAPEVLAVDLSSERVRVAQEVIEGIRNGQSLGALLGYRLERALHDQPNLFLDRLMYELRRAFPLAGNRNEQTKTDESTDINLVEARNVVDGVGFLDHLAEKRVNTYPYALTDLPPLSEYTGPGLPSAAEIGSIIDRQVAHMKTVADAVGDLAVAEGVYQVVRGNYERAGGSLDAFSKGTYPPIPELPATPRSGRTLTHRIALHLAGNLAASGPPRSKGSPAIARWLERQLPETARVFARVRWKSRAGSASGEHTPSIAELGVNAVDLFYMLDAGRERDMAGFDDLLIDYAEQHGAVPHDAVFELEYKPAGVPLTLFELAPLVRALRGMLLGARPLRPTDLALQNEASATQDAGVIVRTDHIAAVKTDLEGLQSSIDAFVTQLNGAIGDGVSPEAARDAARDNIDGWMLAYAALVRSVVPFGLQAASLTTAVEGRRLPFGRMLDAMTTVIDRWQSKQTEYRTTMTSYAALPSTATDEERQAILVRAGRIVSTRVLTELLPISGLESRVAGLRGTLDAHLLTLQGLRDAASKLGATLASLSGFAPSLAEVDQTPFDLAPHRDSVLALAQELSQKAGSLRDDVARRVSEANDALTRASVASGDKAHAFVSEAIHALLGSAFVVLPEFAIGSSETRAEWENVWNNRAALLAHLAAHGDFPIDDWLHGVGRVRERARHLEMASLLGPALGAQDELGLVALQFPHRPNDAWLGLRFPDTAPDGTPFSVKEDKLLYTAHFATGATIDPSAADTPYCGLLLDEWIEVVPTDHETTGLAFHFNRPNAEAPQAILLVTPPVQRGSWQFQDIVEALHETLDFARLRAVEPAQLDDSALGPLIPAVLSAVTMFPITTALNYAFSNKVHLKLATAENE
jgi:hypothetical protein